MKRLFLGHVIIFLLGSLIACKSFKLDSEKNCLNQQSACFKWDKTNPTFVSADPAPNTQRATLPTITLVFSEELKNAEDKTSYTLSGTGASGLSIASVKKTANFTYEVSLNGSITSSNPIKLDFAPLKDFSDNFVTGTTSVEYVGNVSVALTGTSNHNGLGIGGYTDITVNFQHTYNTNPKNTWQIRISNGPATCNSGTQVQSSPVGSYLAANTNQVSNAFPIASFTPGTNRIIVCVQNEDNTTVLNMWSWQIIRDDTAPTLSSATPASDSYGPGADPFTITCGDNAETIAITSLSQTGSAPPAPADPTFNVTTGAITNGAAYTGPITIPNPTNPTFTNYKWRCMDVAGHLDAGVGSRNYGIDINIPPVAITLSGSYHTAVSNQAGAYANTTLEFTTDIGRPPVPPAPAGSQYKIIRGGTGCSDGAATTLIAITNLPPAGTPVSNIFGTANFPAAGTQYDVRLCVRNALDTLWGTKHLQIWRDDAAPTFGGVTTLTNTNDGTVTLFWNAATDAHSGIAGYDICQATATGACAATFTVNYQALAGSTSYEVTGLAPATTYFFVVRARDNAGNRETNTAERKSRLNLSVQVTGYAGTSGDLRLSAAGNTLGYTSSITQTFPQVFNAGDAYSVSIINHPGSQHCGFVANQFGSITSDTTLQVQCVTGTSLARRVQPNATAQLNYHLYRGNATTLVAAGLNHPNEMTYTGGFLYFGDYTNENPPASGTCSGNNCRIVSANSTTGALVTVIGTLSGAVRGIATDGVSLYYTITGQSAVYKVPTGGGTQLTVATGFSLPTQLAYANGAVFVADAAAGAIKKIDLSTGQVSVLAPATGNLSMEIVGSTLYFVTTSHTINSVPVSGGTPAVAFGSTGVAGFRDGTSALFNSPHDIASDGVANLYVSDKDNHRIRRIDLRSGRVSTIAGSGSTGFAAGIGAAANLQNPVGIASDGRNLYANLHNVHRTVKITDFGLVGYWPIAPGVNPNDYNSGGAAVNNGTVNGGSLGTTVDRFGTANLASTFNGTSQYISAIAPITAANACNVTMAAWYRPSSLASNQGIAYNGNSGSSGFGLMYNPVNGIQVLLGGVGSSPASGGYHPTVGQWVHLTTRCQNGLWAIFVNGHKVSEVAAAASAVVPAGLSIGRDSSTLYTNGSIADVRIYNRALGEGEINELAQDAAAAQVGASYSTRATGLLSHFEFNGGSFSDSAGLNLTVASGTGTMVQGKDSDANGAYRFSGAQYLTTTNGNGLPIGSHPRTMCAWTKIETNNFGWYAGAVAYGTSAGGAPPFSVYSLAYTIGSPGTHMIWGDFGDVATTRVPNINTWTHVCASFDGSTNRIYENGTEIINHNAVLPNTQAGALRIGCWVNGINCIVGSVDDLRIYNGALSPFQIRQLATQIPAGLVARYDFNGDKADVSGFGQDLGNNGVSHDIDRFGIANASARLNSSAYFDGTMNGFPLGNSPRTVCAWTNPTTLFNGTFSEVVMYGTATNGWGFGMDASGGLPNGRIFILDTAGDLIYNQPHGLNVWRHICISYSSGTEQIFLDGTSVASVVRPISTAMGQLFIGRGTFGPGDYFNGNIDDVRIYNRALSIPEIQVLLQQPNKRMVFSATANAGMHDGGGGISGADSICLSAGTNYKALIIGGSERRACTSANCATGGITENIDWVLRPNATYLRADNVTPIQTANLNSVLPFPLLNSISGGASTRYWTGFNTDWTGAANCLNGTSWNTTAAGVNGIYGLSDQIGTGMLYNFGPPNNGCNNSYNLVCVQQ